MKVMVLLWTTLMICGMEELLNETPIIGNKRNATHLSNQSQTTINSPLAKRTATGIGKYTTPPEIIARSKTVWNITQQMHAEEFEDLDLISETK